MQHSKHTNTNNRGQIQCSQLCYYASFSNAIWL